jgi:hypothetical protein
MSCRGVALTFATLGCVSTAPNSAPRSMSENELAWEDVYFCSDHIAPAIEGTLTNTAGEDILPSAVTVQADGAVPQACGFRYGHYECQEASSGLYNVTVILGARRYEQQIIPPFDGCHVTSVVRLDFVAEAKVDEDGCEDKLYRAVELDLSALPSGFAVSRTFGEGAVRAEGNTLVLLRSLDGVVPTRIDIEAIDVSDSCASRMGSIVPPVRGIRVGCGIDVERLPVPLDEIECARTLPRDEWGSASRNGSERISHGSTGG